MIKKGPRKPSAPVSAVVWRAGGGPPHLISEPLPESKDALERAIVDRFIVTIREEHGLLLEPPTKPLEWPDFETRAGDRKIGIEVVEVIEPAHARKKARQVQYREQVHS